MAREEGTGFTVVRVDIWSSLYYQGEHIDTVKIEDEPALLAEWIAEPFVRWASGNVHDVYDLQPVTDTINSINTDMKDLMDTYFRAVRG